MHERRTQADTLSGYTVSVQHHRSTKTVSPLEPRLQRSRMCPNGRGVNEKSLPSPCLWYIRSKQHHNPVLTNTIRGRRFHTEKLVQRYAWLHGQELKAIMRRFCRKETDPIHADNVEQGRHRLRLPRSAIVAYHRRNPPSRRRHEHRSRLNDLHSSYVTEKKGSVNFLR